MRLASDDLFYSRFVIVSGATGLDLDAFPAPEPNDLFGWLVTNVGDLDADNVPDLAVAAPRAHVGIPGDGVRGRAYILSGATHDTLLTIDGDWWGFSGLGLVVVDDQDADGVLDLLIAGMQRMVEVDPGNPGAPDGDNPIFEEPPTDGPVAYFHSTWSLHSLGAGVVLEAGDGAPPVRFIRPGESMQQLWLSGPIPGPRLWLEGASGDLNGDGIVDMQDLLRLIEAMSDPNRADPLDHTFKVGDLNGDGAVDTTDLTTLLTQYGQTASEIARSRNNTDRPTTTPNRDCTDQYGFPGGGGGDCFMDCPDCEFDLPADPPGGGCTDCCPGLGCPHCNGCNGCLECPPPPPGCTTQCECFPCSCDNNKNGEPDKNDDDDGDGILNKHDCDSLCYTGQECACAEIKLFADTNNDGELDNQDRSDEPDPAAMHVIIVNRGDTDEDDIPDYADGFGKFGEATESGTGGNYFAIITINAQSACSFETSEITFSYNAADPDDTTVEVIDVPDIESSYQRFSRGNGLLRIWKRDGHQPRSEDDFVAPDTVMYGADIGPVATFFVEAVNGSSTPTQITVRMVTAEGHIKTDSVQILPFDSQTGLDVSEISGYTIFSGSATGTPGNDIIIGSSDNDLIDAGDGDDIIVAGDGDDVIYAGNGTNTIFCEFGHNTINSGGFDPTRPEASPVDARGGDGAPSRVISRRDRASAKDPVLQAYYAMYGANDPWIQIYLEDEAFRGTVEVYELEGWTNEHEFQASWDDNFDWYAEPKRRYVIKLPLNPEQPFRSAPALRKQLLSIAGDGNHGSRYFKAAFGDQLNNIAYTRAYAQDFADINEPLENYDQVRLLAFNNTIAAAAAIADAYTNSIRIISVGTDVVMAINDVSEGRPVAAVFAAFPLIGAPAVTGTRWILRLSDGSEPFSRVGRLIKGAESGLGWVRDRSMVIRDFVINGKVVALLGTAQEVRILHEGLPTATAHAATVERRALELVQSGAVEYAAMARSINVATGLEIGEQGRKIPDYMGIRRDGKIDIFEVRSAGQTRQELEEKLQRIWDALPPDRQGTFAVFELD